MVMRRSSQLNPDDLCVGLDEVGVFVFRLNEIGVYEIWLPSKTFTKLEFRGDVCTADDIPEFVAVLPLAIYSMNRRNTACTMKASLTEYFIACQPNLEPAIAELLRSIDTFPGSSKSNMLIENILKADDLSASSQFASAIVTQMTDDFSDPVVSESTVASLVQDCVNHQTEQILLNLDVPVETEAITLPLTPMDNEMMESDSSPALESSIFVNNEMMRLDNITSDNQKVVAEPISRPPKLTNSFIVYQRNAETSLETAQGPIHCLGKVIVDDGVSEFVLVSPYEQDSDQLYRVRPQETDILPLNDSHVVVPKSWIDYIRAKKGFRFMRYDSLSAIWCQLRKGLTYRVGSQRVPVLSPAEHNAGHDCTDVSPAETRTTDYNQRTVRESAVTIPPVRGLVGRKVANVSASGCYNHQPIRSVGTPDSLKFDLGTSKRIRETLDDTLDLRAIGTFEDSSEALNDYLISACNRNLSIGKFLDRSDSTIETQQRKRLSTRSLPARVVRIRNNGYQFSQMNSPHSLIAAIQDSELCPLLSSAVHQSSPHGYIGVKNSVNAETQAVQYSPYLVHRNGQKVMIGGLYDSAVEAAFVRDNILRRMGISWKLNFKPNKYVPSKFKIDDLTKQTVLIGDNLSPTNRDGLACHMESDCGATKHSVVNLDATHLAISSESLSYVEHFARNIPNGIDLEQAIPRLTVQFSATGRGQYRPTHLVRNVINAPGV